VRRRIHPGLNSVAADFHTLGDLHDGMFRYPGYFRDSASFFHSRSFSVQGSEVKSRRGSRVRLNTYSGPNPIRKAPAQRISALINLRYI
jgi:hypothetical protein